jgi:hypothetical protein
MDAVDRLFRHLVSHLATAAPDHLTKPFQVSELYQRIIPYRTHKRQLAFDSIEDYEMAVLRLLAGEHDYASLEPVDVQTVLAEEIQLPNPTPGAFREYAAATVMLNRDAVRGILNQDEAYAPPAVAESVVQVPMSAGESRTSPPPPNPPEEPAANTLVFEPVEPVARCSQCASELPARRQAEFCPWCGHRLGTTQCRQCGESLETEWSYCLACGHPTRG